MVHLSARLLTFMPTYLLFYSCNLFCCDTKFVLSVQPPAEENSKPFLYSVGCSLYLHWWRTLMPSGCNMCNCLNSRALVFGLFISLVFFFLGLLVAATTMGHIRTVVTLTLLWAVGSMGLLRAIFKWASNAAVESVGLGPSGKWVYMGRNRA